MTPSSSLFLARTTNAALARGLLTWGSRQPLTKTLSYFSLILLMGKCVSVEHQTTDIPNTYRMVGGAPAGIDNRPPFPVCLNTIMRIVINSMIGNRMITPIGIEMRELPRSRIRRLKKLHLGVRYSACAATFSNCFGKAGVDGNRFLTPCKKSMMPNMHLVFRSRSKVESGRRCVGGRAFNYGTVRRWPRAYF